MNRSPLRNAPAFLLLMLMAVATASAQTAFPNPDWKVETPESQSMSAAGIDKVGAWLKDNGSKTGMVVRHGRIVGEWYFDDAKPESQYLVYSTSKSFASTAAGLAIANGKLKLDSKVGEFFPDAAPPTKRDVTVRQIISMTTGAKSDNTILDRRDLFNYVLHELPMEAAPGEKWEYNNSGLSLLGPVITKATGQNLDQLLDEEIFQKIGIARDTWHWDDRDGGPIPYSGLHITARSLARFGLLFLNKGQWASKKIVSSTWVKEATHTSQDLKKDYGYLWWNNSTDSWPGVPSDAYAARGKFNNDMLIVPSLDLIVIRQVGDDSAHPDRKIKIEELFALACAAITDPSPSLKIKDSASNVEVEKAFPNLQFERGVQATHAGDGSNRLFVPTQLGIINVFPNDSKVEEPQVFLDIEPRTEFKKTENEKGLLGLAFHPKYKQNGEFFVYYTPTGTAKPHTVAISRFRVSKDDPNKADPDSEERLLEIEEPFWNHKGGTLAFGPDGYLYIAVGDGGAFNDPFGNGQNLNTLLGKILRIDVDHKDEGKKYAVPKDNPFVGQKDIRGEIWAYGLRNPWRIAFDPKTGTLWCADVGQDLWEEIDIITKAGNYGWNLREGFHKFSPKGNDGRSDLIEPVWEYHHETGKSITGGQIYRGKSAPELAGCYIYADYVAGKLWALKLDEQNKQVVANLSIAGNIAPIVSFGEDEQGEMYYLTDGGQIYRFRAAAK